jgi:hypothetical protein
VLAARAEAVLAARADLPQIEAADGDDVPAPAARGSLGKLRVSLNRVLTESIPLAQGNGHGDGHGNGQAGEPTAVTAGDGQPESLEQPGGGSDGG